MPDENTDTTLPTWTLSAYQATDMVFSAANNQKYYQLRRLIDAGIRFAASQSRIRVDFTPESIAVCRPTKAELQEAVDELLQLGYRIHLREEGIPLTVMWNYPA